MSDERERIKRALDLEGDDKAAALNALQQALRDDDPSAAFRALVKWAVKPLHHEHIASLRMAIRIYTERRRFNEALDCIAFALDHAEGLGELRVRRPVLVAMDLKGMRVAPSSDITTQPEQWFEVSPRPRNGKRYLLVDADEVQRIPSAGMMDVIGMIQQRVALLSLISNAAEYHHEQPQPPPVEWTVTPDVMTASPPGARIRVERADTDSADVIVTSESGARIAWVTVHQPLGVSLQCEASEIAQALYWSWWRAQAMRAEGPRWESEYSITYE
jgi:hypothetical protein